MTSVDSRIQDGHADVIRTTVDAVIPDAACSDVWVESTATERPFRS